MLKEFTWKTFENTGNIDAYMLYREIEQSLILQKDRETAEQEVAISN